MARSMFLLAKTVVTGTGFDLTASFRLFMLDVDFLCKNVTQAVSRVH